MGSSEKLCLKWDDFQSNISTSFCQMRQDQHFSDVTLTCDGDQQVQAHKVILSASSSFFNKLLNKNKHPHPLLYMRGLTDSQLNNVLDFIYHGEVNIYEDNLEEFLNLADQLQLKGLKKAEAESKDSQQIEYQAQKSEPQTTPKQHLSESMIFEERAMVLAESTVKAKTNNADLDETINSMMERLETGGYSCNVCGKIELKFTSNMRKHIESMHVTGVAHPCGHCGKSYRSRNSLSNHISVNHKAT